MLSYVWGGAVLNTLVHSLLLTCFNIVHVSFQEKGREGFISLVFVFFVAEMEKEEGTPWPGQADPLCPSSVTQPFPRSPKTLRKPGVDSLKYSQVCLHSVLTAC